HSTPTVPGNTLAVLPFRVAGPDSGVWREGLVDLLSINLDGAPGVRVIAPRTVLSRWNADVGRRADVVDQDAALGVARAVGARFALTGSLVGGTRSVRLSAGIRDRRRGTDLGMEQVEGSADSVPALVDRLTLLLLRAGLVPDSAALPTFDLARPTTTSLDAEVRAAPQIPDAHAEPYRAAPAHERSREREARAHSPSHAQGGILIGDV